MRGIEETEPKIRFIIAKRTALPPYLAYFKIFHLIGLQTVQSVDFPFVGVISSGEPLKMQMNMILDK